MSLGLKNSLVSSFGRRDSQSLTSPVSSKSVPLVSPMTSLAIELGNSRLVIFVPAASSLPSPPSVDFFASKFQTRFSSYLSLFLA